MLPLKQVNTRVSHEAWRRFNERAAESNESTYTRLARLIHQDIGQGAEPLTTNGGELTRSRRPVRATRCAAERE